MSKGETTARDAWEVHNDSQSFDDPLLGCLILLTKLQHRPFSADALRAGLPLVNNRLTPDLFERAAERAGLSSRIVRRQLNEISELVLPAILLLEEGQACVLVSFNKTDETATLLQPESGAGEYTTTLENLTKHYTGLAIFVRSEHRFDERTPEVLTQKSRHWFWGTLFRSWRIYRDVLAASLMVNIFALASPLFIMNVYDRVVPNNAKETLWVLAIGVVIVFVFDFLMKTLRSFFIDIAGKKTDIALSAMILEKVLGLRMEVRPSSVGAFANNLREFDSIRDFITSATITGLIDLPFILLFLTVISLIGGPLVFVPLLGIPVVLLYGFAIQPALRHAVDHTFRASAQKNATLIESLTGIETIKTLGAESLIQRKWEHLVGYIARFGVRTRLLSTSAVNLAVFVQQLTMVGVVVYGVYLITDGDLSMGGLIACVLLTGRALAPMAQIANLAVNYHQATAALKS
ncbi:MAG: ABC transporter transmembrane domain-containing protein, partial [Gammaproteobacteria bacterium]|nr:ABC transporter transmembrane domain-containing protein [Gammaproteobacteria bacterium]